MDPINPALTEQIIEAEHTRAQKRRRGTTGPTPVRGRPTKGNRFPDTKISKEEKVGIELVLLPEQFGETHATELKESTCFPSRKAGGQSDNLTPDSHLSSEPPIARGKALLAPGATVFKVTA